MPPNALNSCRPPGAYELKRLDDRLWQLTREICAGIEAVGDDAELASFRRRCFEPMVLGWYRRSAIVDAFWTKPSGYSGDYSTIEQLCRNDQRWGRFEDIFANHLLRCEMADQHRGKVGEQARFLLEKLQPGAGGNVRLLDVGCGPCFDLRWAVGQLPRCDDAEVVLVDLDAGSLEFSAAQLDGKCQGLRVTCVREDVFKAVRRLAAGSGAGTFDGVVFGGLFDYLPDRIISMVLKASARLLAEGGEILFSQVSRTNPDRTFMK